MQYSAGYPTTAAEELPAGVALAGRKRRVLMR